jgi:hypothetical protein
MSKLNCSQVVWARPDVFGLFSASEGTFSIIVGLSATIFSLNMGTKLRCYQAGRFMLSRRYNYLAFLEKRRNFWR